MGVRRRHQRDQPAHGIQADPAEVAVPVDGRKLRDGFGIGTDDMDGGTERPRVHGGALHCSRIVHRPVTPAGEPPACTAADSLARHVCAAFLGPSTNNADGVCAAVPGVSTSPAAHPMMDFSAPGTCTRIVRGEKSVSIATIGSRLPAGSAPNTRSTRSIIGKPRAHDGPMASTSPRARTVAARESTPARWVRLASATVEKNARIGVRLHRTGAGPIAEAHRNADDFSH